jgi:hypothetical protein
MGMGDIGEGNSEDVRAELRRMCLNAENVHSAEPVYASLVEELRALSLQCRPCRPGALQDPEYHDANLFGEWELRDWVGGMTFNEKIKEVWQKIKDTDTEEAGLWRFPTNFDRSRRQPQNGGGGSRGGSGQKPPCVACFSILLKHTPRYRYIYDLWDTDNTNGEQKLVVLRNMLRVRGRGRPPTNDGLNNNQLAEQHGLGVAWDDLSVMLRTKSGDNDNGSGNGIFIDDPYMYAPQVFAEKEISWDDVHQWFLMQHQGVHVNTPVQARVKEWVQLKSELQSRILHETEKKKGEFFLGLKLCNKHTAQVREIWPDTIIVPTKNKDTCKHVLADGSKCERKQQGYSLNGDIVCATCMFDNNPIEYATQFANKYKGKGNRANYKRKEKTVLKGVRGFLCKKESIEAHESADTVVPYQANSDFNKKITVRGYNNSIADVQTAGGNITFFIPDLIVHVHGDTSDEAAVTKVIVVEIDELQHRVYKLSRELTREQLICQKLAETYTNLTHIHIVRFNPDGYRYTTDAYPKSGESGANAMGIYGAPGPYNNKPPALTTKGVVNDQYNPRMQVLKNKLKSIINNDDNNELQTEMERTYLSGFKRPDGKDVVCRKTHLFYDEGFSNASADENTVNIHSIQIGKKT